MATPNLGLVLPTPTVTLGPVWANELNAALEVIDSHDHTSGKGLRVPTAGLNINAELDFQENRALNLGSSLYTSNASTLTGGSNANSVYVTLGNLYFTNESGTAVQITDGGALVSPPGNAQVFEFQNVSSSLTIGPADTFVYLAVDTTAARTITLPLANSVASGRIYILKDVSDNADNFNITLDTSGSDLIDGQSSVAINSASSTTMVIGDGVSNWYIS